MLVNPWAFASVSAAALPPRTSTAQLRVYREYASAGEAKQQQQNITATEANSDRRPRNPVIMVGASLIFGSDYLAL